MDAQRVIEGQSGVAPVLSRTKDGRLWFSTIRGLLMLDPSARGHGLGARVCRTTFDWIAQEGARAVWIGVQEKNERAHNFWSRLGFVDVERQPYVASNGYETTVVLMKKSVGQTRMSGPHL